MFFHFTSSFEVYIFECLAYFKGMFFICSSPLLRWCRFSVYEFHYLRYSFIMFLDSMLGWHCVIISDHTSSFASVCTLMIVLELRSDMLSSLHRESFTFSNVRMQFATPPILISPSFVTALFFRLPAFSYVFLRRDRIGALYLSDVNIVEVSLLSDGFAHRTPLRSSVWLYFQSLIAYRIERIDSYNKTTTHTVQSISRKR